MLYTSLLNQKYLLNNIIYNNFKKNLFTKVNTICKNDFKNDFKNEYINDYIYKKQLKITNATCCKYCKGTGWIIWKTNNLYTLKTNKSFIPMFSYSLCYKCNDL
jgi:hypothetical protein